MLPSGRFFLNRDTVYETDRRARQRALWLYDQVLEDVQKTAELNIAEDKRYKARQPPFPKLRGKEPEISNSECRRVWGVVAEVAAAYPRLLAWLAEGRVSGTWNVFGFLVGVARLIPGLRWILWHFMFKPVACYAPWRTALYEAILQDQRSTENIEKPAETLVCIGPEVPGLSAITDVAAIQGIPGRDELRQRVVNMSSGCIGISGPRGSGKTALMQDFCSHRYGTPRVPTPTTNADRPLLPGMRVMIQAPLPFDAREYLIHQYACLCEAVLADVRFNPTMLFQRALGPILRPGLGRPRALLGGLAGIALLVLAAFLFAGTWPHWDPRTWELVGAVAALVAGLAAIGWRTRWAFIEARQVVTLAADAQARLQRLQYARTDTRTRGGKLGGPMGAGVSMGTSSEFAELAMTLPELIDDYRDFVERVVGGLEQAERAERTKQAKRAKQAERDSGDGRSPDPETSVRLVIGLDEIDQIDDATEACRFLDELSAVFGTPQCVYLIAVSPSTLAASDQRMVPLRTSSGGLFDEMVWLDPLTEPQAKGLLSRRVTGLPPSFAKLCYVLSGGLPRELLRVARVLFTTPGARSGTATLAGAARHVIAGEIAALKHRALASAASLTVSAAPGLFRLLSDDQWPMSQINDEDAVRRRGQHAVIDKILGDVSVLWTGGSRAGFREPGKDVAPFTSEVCDSLLASLYFLLTVHQLFTATPDRDDWLDDVPHALQDLSRACHALSTNPYLAALLVGAAREQLAAKEYPEFTITCAPRFLSQATHTQLMLGGD